MSRYTLDPDVRKDLDEIWDQIGVRHRSPATATRQIERLYERFAYLGRHPHSGEIRDDLGEGVRAFVARPYLILLRPKNGGVEILQVVHAARDLNAVVRRKDRKEG